MGKLAQQLADNRGLLENVVSSLKSIDEKNCEILPKRMEQVDEVLKIAQGLKVQESCLQDYQDSLDKGSCGSDNCYGLLKICMDNSARVEASANKLAEIGKEIAPAQEEIGKSVGDLQGQLGQQRGSQNTAQGGKTVTIRLPKTIRGETVKTIQFLTVSCNGLDILVMPSAYAVYDEASQQYTQDFSISSAELEELKAKGCDTG